MKDAPKTQSGALIKVFYEFMQKRGDFARYDKMFVRNLSKFIFRKKGEENDTGTNQEA